MATRQPPRTRDRKPSARLLPHNASAEASVLGGILLRPDTLAVVAAHLTPDSFHNPCNREVFDAMLALDARGESIDPVTLEYQLQTAGRLDAIGGIAYLGKLALRVPTTDNVERYATIVRDTHAVRRLMLALSDLVERGYHHAEEVSAYQARALATISDAIDSATDSGPRPIPQGIRALARELDRRYSAPDGNSGVPTGRTELDRHLGGLQPPDLIILAARPAMGKTALALDIAANAAARGVPVVVFSLEMTMVQMVERLVCAQARITPTALRKGEVSYQQKDELTDALADLATLPLHLDDTAALTHHQVRARARRFALQYRDAPHGLVVVDYLQLMRSPDRHGTREQEIAAISGALKALAKGLGWPVLALSQLNRGLESRSNKRPMLSDLRESGALEQDADLVLMLYREAAYDESADPEHAELIIAKNRHGAPGTIELRFEAQYTRFDDWRRQGFKPRLVD